MTADRMGSPDRVDSRSDQRWVYESILGSIPGVSLSRSGAIVLQIALFETAVLVTVAALGQWGSLAAGTTAVVVASVGSVFMLTIAGRTRRLDVPGEYPYALFGTGIEVVLGLLSFLALVTYLFVIDPRSTGTTLLAGLLGTPLPVPAVFLTLLVLWDVCYRIGTGWWASLVGLWRSLRHAGTFEHSTARGLERVDALTVGFAWIQLSLVPFVGDRPILIAAIVGHVVAVTAVSGASILVLRWRQ